MHWTETTSLINSKLNDLKRELDDLKRELDAIPAGGGLECLKDSIQGLRGNLDLLLDDIDRFNNHETK